jgi:hypothetical protein
LFSCIKVIHSKPLFFIFSEEAFKFVSDLCAKYDQIAIANEIDEQYIAYVYGKSKSHFKRIAGCLWAIEIAIKVLTQIEQIPTTREEFIDVVLSNVALISNSNEIDLDCVTKASKVIEYFIAHKLILSDMERDQDSNEYAFIDKTVDANKNKSSKTISKQTPATLEQKILLTDGRIVYLTPLSKSGQCKSSAFVDACAKLSEKSLGVYDSKIRATTSSVRSASGFRKSAVPAKGSSEEAVFINSLFDFGCNIDDYRRSLSLDDILPPPPTPKLTETSSNSQENRSSSSKAIKRLSHDTSLQNISNIAKLNKSDSLNRKDEDEDDE